MEFSSIQGLVNGIMWIPLFDCAVQNDMEPSQMTLLAISTDSLRSVSYSTLYCSRLC